MSGSYTQTYNQVNRDMAAKKKGTGWRDPTVGIVEDMHGVEVTDLGIEESRGDSHVETVRLYSLGALAEYATAAAFRMAESARPGEEGPEPQTA